MKTCASIMCECIHDGAAGLRHAGAAVRTGRKDGSDSRKCPACGLARTGLDMVAVQ